MKDGLAVVAELRTRFAQAKADNVGRGGIGEGYWVGFFDALQRVEDELTPEREDAPADVVDKGVAGLLGGGQSK